MKKRLLSLLFVLALCLGLLPTSALAAGPDIEKAIQLVDSGTAANIGGAQADNIYFGNYFQSNSTTKEPVKWRVLSNSDGKLFLLSDQNLDVKPYNSSYTSITWEKSTIRSWLNGYAASENNSGTNYSSNNFIDAAFSSDEQVAIADTYVYNKTQSNGTSNPNPSYSTSGGENTTDKIFLLSIEEANNSSYFPNGNDSRKSTNTAYVASYSGMFGAGKTDYWWLRSPGFSNSDAANVRDGGGVPSNGGPVDNTACAVRPAFNLNLNSVLFTSAAVGGKSPAAESGGQSGEAADAIFEIGDYSGNEWKLTLLDNSRNFSISDAAINSSGDTMVFSYSDAKTGANEYISVVIEDSGAITHYGRILQLDGTTNGASGTASLTLPAGVRLGDTTKLYVFNEQYNGGENDNSKLTDYGSELIKVNPTVDDTAPTLSNGSATRDSETSATVKFTSDEAGSYYYEVVNSGENQPTIDTAGTGTTCDTTEQTISLTNLSDTSAKDIYIVVKDAVGNVSQTLQIVIPEFIPTYTISASPAALNFSNKTVGYTEAPDGQTVTITNTGNQTVTVTLPTSTNYTITVGTGFVDGTATLAPNGTAEFTVRPVTGLDADSHSETLTISSDHDTSAEVSLAFTVDPKSLDGAQVQVSGSYIYDGNAKEPSGENVTVTLDGEPLTENTDYTLSYEDNTDAGEATVKVSGKGNYSGTVTGTFQIAKATPTVSDVAVSSPATIYASTDISTITLTHGADDTPGTVKLDDGQTLSVDKTEYTWTFTPSSSNYITATGIITLTVTKDTLEKIEVTQAPTKTIYTYGDSFDKAGMEVTATYASGETKDVTNEVVITPDELTVGMSALTITFGGKETTLNITVSPKEISIDSATVADKTYDGKTDATVENVTFSDNVQLKANDYTAMAVFDDASANDSQSATVKVTLTNDSYTFGTNSNEKTTTAKIAQRPVTLSWSETTSFTYDGTQKTVTAEVTNAVDGDTLNLEYENNAKTAVGEYTAKVTGLDNSNYTLDNATGVELTWRINGASIAGATVELSGYTFTYNGSEQKPTVAVKLNGNPLTANDYDVQFSGDSIDADTYTVTVTGKNNYSGAAESKTYTIEKATVTPSIDTTDTITKTYDGTANAPDGLSITLTGVLNNDTVTATASFAYDSADAGKNKTVTASNITLSGEDAGNYTLSVETAETTGTITPASLAVTADAKSKTYGEADPELTYQVIGLIGADTLTGELGRDAGENVGEYTITLGSLTAGSNYNVSFADAKLTITARPVELTWSTETSFTYDGNSHSVTAEVSNAVNGDTFTLTYDDNAKTAVGNYTAKVTGLGNDNYTLTGASGTEQAWSIVKANPDVNVPTGLTATYGNTLNDVNLPDGWAWDAPDTAVGNVGSNAFAATYTPEDADNYNTVPQNLTVAVSAKDISGADITLDGSLTYTGQEQTQQIASVTVDGLAVTYTVTGNTGTDAGDYTLTVTGTGNFTGTATKGWSIAKANYTGTTGVSGTVLANWPDKVTLPDIPAGASYGTPSTTDDLTGLSIEGGVLHYTGGESITEGQEYKITVPVNGGTNYNDYQITVTLTGSDKQTLTITGVTAQNGTYNGQTQAGYAGTPAAVGYTGDFTVTYNTEDGKAPTNAGTYSVTIAIPDTDPQYVGSIVLEFTIAKKALTVSAPSASVYVGDNAPELALTYTGLVDGESVTPSEAPAFTITKSDDTEIALADAVQTAGTYTITWSNAGDTTFLDGANYAIQTETTGTLTVSARSSGGGGSSNITTEITKNPDGSTTTTVTNKNTGTVTETTKFPDGSKEVVETKKDGTVTTTTTDTAGNKTQVVENTDGSSKTTVDNKDGSGSVTLVDENGQVVSEATLSQSAVAAAQEKGEAVALPMPEVPVTTDRENAPTVTVDLPSGTSAKVEIPVADVTPGTVAVIVKADGTEEVIKTSLTTENGVAVTLSDGDTVKVVDNSKTFEDVPATYWGAEAVDFATSRELFAGTSATTFAPDTAMTRAMIVTVLARFEGVDTTTGSTWYEAGQQWAMQNGVSDGSNMDASLTREQLATMFYRYAQSKGYDTTQGGMAIREYADFEQISDYAVEAMTWAVNTGLISGTSTTTLSPQGEATRAQVATILMRFIEGMA